MVFLILFIVLLAWIFSWAIFPFAGGLLHLLLVIAIISLIFHFVRGSRTTTAWPACDCKPMKPCFSRSGPKAQCNRAASSGLRTKKLLLLTCA